MSYRGDSEDIEEEEEEEEEDDDKGNAKSLIKLGEKGNRHGQIGSGEDRMSRGSRHSGGSFDDGQLSNNVKEDDSTGRNNDGDQDAPVRRSSNSDEAGAGGKDRLSPPRQVSSGEFESDLDYNEEEDDQRKSRTVERRGKQGSDEGELSSDEEGEIKEKLYRDHRPRYRTRQSRSLSPVPHRRLDTSICRHYLAGTCDWGRSCRFRHPPADELIQLKEKGFLPVEHRPRRHEGREGWSNLRGTPPHRSAHPHDGTPFGVGSGYGPFPGHFPHGYPIGGDFGHQPYPQGPYPPGPYMDPGRPPFTASWMGYGPDSQGGMQEESDGWIRLKMPVMSSSWDIDDTSPPRHKKKRRRNHSSASDNSDEEGKLKSKKKKKKKHKESDSEESSLGQKAERKRKKKQKQKETEHTSYSDGEDTMSKGKMKKAKQRRQQKEDSQERSTDSGREKKTTKEKATSLSRGTEWRKTREKGRAKDEDDSGEPKGHKYKEIERELQIVTAAINRRNRNKH